MNHLKKTALTLSLPALALLTACGGSEPAAESGGIEPQVFADSLYAVMSSDRANYTNLIIQRLGPNEGNFIRPSEHWEDMDEGAPLPAQMFRYGAEKVAESTDTFSYSLQSLWPVNKQNAPKTELEKTGLQYIADNPGENFYGEEELGGVTYYTAIYADTAVSPACVSCHNEHIDSPRTDFMEGEVMGGVVIRIPLGN